MKKKNYIYWLLLLLVLGSITYGEERIEIDLEKARQMALENNPAVKLAREAVLKAKSQITEARSGLLPAVNGFSQIQHAWEVQKSVMPNFIKDMMGPAAPPGMPDYVTMQFGLENTIVYGVSLQQPLYVGGAIWNGYKISVIGERLAKAQLKITEQNILSGVTGSYYSILFAKSTVDVSKDALKSAEKNLDQVKKFFDAGKASNFDVLRAEVQVANYRPLVLSSVNNLRIAKSQLGTILGINKSAEFIFTDKLKYKPTELLEKSFEELLDFALANRPEITLIKGQQNIAHKQLSLAKSAIMPSLSLGTSYQYQGQKDGFDFSGDDFYKSFNSSLSLNIPIFNGLKNKSKIQQAKIGIKESSYQKDSMINNIRLEVEAAYFKAKEAEEKVMTQKKTIEQAEEALRLANLMYSEGASTQLDVLNANLAVNQSKMNYQQSLFEYNVAIAGLKKSINQL